MKREAAAQVLWGNYIKENRTFYGNFELKQTNSNTLLLSRFYHPTEQRQILSLMSAQEKGYYWKHSDMDIREKPFDCSNSPPVPGYIVVYWASEKVFTAVLVLVFINYLEQSKLLGKKVLDYKTACDIAYKIVKL